MASKAPCKYEIQKLQTLQSFLKSEATMMSKAATRKAIEILNTHPHMDIALFKKQFLYYRSFQGGMHQSTVAIQKALDKVTAGHSGSGASHSRSRVSRPVRASRLTAERDMIAYLKTWDAGMHSQTEAENLAEQYAQFVPLNKLKPMVEFFKSWDAGMLSASQAVTKALRTLQQHPHIELSTIKTKTAHYKSFAGGMKDANTAVNLAIQDAVREVRYSWDSNSYDW